MHIRWLLFTALSGSHSIAVLISPEILAPAVAGSVYIPLMLVKSAGVPVFAAAESGGWAAPSLLGWALVILVWAAIWWAVASLISRLLRRTNRNA